MAMDASSAAELPRTEPGIPPGLPPLLIGIGNPGRGDDALGCAVVEGLRCDREFALGCDLIWVYQLQPELALDLLGRPALLFVDAMRAVSGAPRLRLDRLEVPARAAATTQDWTSHALSPPALLQLLQRLAPEGPWPAAWLLGIAGEDWALGAPLSATAQTGLGDALVWVRAWRRSLGPGPAKAMDAADATAWGRGLPAT